MHLLRFVEVRMYLISHANLQFFKCKESEVNERMAVSLSNRLIWTHMSLTD